MATQNPPKKRVEGWLKKKGKKRYFVVENHILYWFTKEQKNVKIQHNAISGCLELKGCELAEEKRPKHAFTIRNVKTLNSYTLIASSAEDQAKWMEDMKKAIELANTQEDANIEIKSGTLMKKGKKRLFSIQKDCLIWFLPDQGKKKAKGSLPLAGATVKGGAKPTSIIIFPLSGKPYEIYASSATEAKEWIEALQGVVDSISGSKAEKSGWLVKKGAKRWFEVRGDRLLWFNSTTRTAFEQPNGYLLLSQCSVKPLKEQKGRRPFRIECPGSKPYVLTASSSQDCADWINAMIAAGCQGTVIDDPTSILVSSGPASERSSLRLSQRHSEDTEVGEEIDSESPTSEGISLLDSLDPNKVEKSGWMTKKGKRRWFKLSEGVFSWHNGPKASINGKVDADDCFVWRLGELANGYFGFSVENETPPAKEYTMETPSESECEGWVNALILAGARPKAGAAPETDSSRDLRKASSGRLLRSGKRNSPIVRKAAAPQFKDADRTGWLEKKGRKRWFLLQDKRLAWFNAPPEKLGVKPNGTLEATSVSVDLVDGPKDLFSIVITSGDEHDKDYTCLAETKEDAEGWRDALVKAGALEGTAVKKQVDSDAPERGRVFGRSLADVLARDRKTDDSTPGVPSLVKTCVEFIKENDGMKAEGIFRISGDTNEVNQLKHLFDEGRNPGLTPDTSVHSVSGTLKAFLREMEPPLIPFELYKPFLENCSNDPVLEQLVTKLPEENRLLLEYLLDFLAECASYSSISQMAPMNLSIVIAPNCLRMNDPLLGLTDAASIGQCFQRLLVMAIEKKKNPPVVPTTDNSVRATAPPGTITPEDVFAMGKEEPKNNRPSSDIIKGSTAAPPAGTGLPAGVRPSEQQMAMSAIAQAAMRHSQKLKTSPIPAGTPLPQGAGSTPLPSGHEAKTAKSSRNEGQKTPSTESYQGAYEGGYEGYEGGGYEGGGYEEDAGPPPQRLPPSKPPASAPPSAPLPSPPVSDSVEENPPGKQEANQSGTAGLPPLPKRDVGDVADVLKENEKIIKARETTKAIQGSPEDQVSQMAEQTGKTEDTEKKKHTETKDAHTAVHAADKLAAMTTTFGPVPKMHSAGKVPEGDTGVQPTTTSKGASLPPETLRNSGSNSRREPPPVSPRNLGVKMTSPRESASRREPPPVSPRSRPPRTRGGRGTRGQQGMGRGGRGGGRGGRGSALGPGRGGRGPRGVMGSGRARAQHNRGGLRGGSATPRGRGGSSMRGMPGAESRTAPDWRKRPKRT